MCGDSIVSPLDPTIPLFFAKPTCGRPCKSLYAFFGDENMLRLASNYAFVGSLAEAITDTMNIIIHHGAKNQTTNSRQTNSNATTQSVGQAMPNAQITMNDEHYNTSWSKKVILHAYPTLTANMTVRHARYNGIANKKRRLATHQTPLKIIPTPTKAFMPISRTSRMDTSV